MSSLYQDSTHTDLIWMEFDGKSWDDFNELLSELIELTKTLDTPYCLIFDPSVDMPKGNPLPHIKRLMRFMDAESKFEHMVAIIPSWMKIAAVFARLALQMFRGKLLAKLGSVVTSREEALNVYSQYSNLKVG